MAIKSDLPKGNQDHALLHVKNQAAIQGKPSAALQLHQQAEQLPELHLNMFNTYGGTW